MITRRNTGWMRDLAFHYEAMRTAYPDDNLLIVFDIDGTIIDEGHMALSVLQAFDREHGTGFFSNISSDDMPLPPGEVCRLLKEFAIPSTVRGEITSWCEANFWSRAAILSSHKPFYGVLDVIRWFQLQPRTFVGLNSARAERLRADTLRILNALGRGYHVQYEDALLHMNTGGAVPQGKVNGIRKFQEKGYRIVAVIDNEKENLEAVARIDPAGEMLLLHTDVMLASSPVRKASKAFMCRYYDLTELINRHHLPQHIEFVWHGVDDESILRQFLVSSVQWAELHVRRHIGNQGLILRRKPYAEVPPVPCEIPVRLEEFLYLLHEAGRGVKLDLKEPGLTGQAIDLLKAAGYTDDHVWITIATEEVHGGALRRIQEAFPRAIKQCPVDSLSTMLTASPGEAKRYLGMLSHAGIGRFSVNWSTPGSRGIIIQLQNWGYEVNIYNVPDLEAFLQAALLVPTSVTSFYNFPKWFYTGPGDEGKRRNQEKTPHRLI
ncbi:MAG TPA: HAD family hydrolase [Desulfomonilia bacterium]|nr:HAD family hydrolase [Desulfomonilia bacterium]